MARKSAASPATAMRTPAMAVPRMRADEESTDPSASAAARCSRPTTCNPHLPMNGFSMAVMTPLTTARMAISVTTEAALIRPLASATTEIASMAAEIASALWLIITIFRAGQRPASATRPANGPMSKLGAAVRAMVRPARVAEPESWSTSQLRPTACIQVPIPEIRSAPAHSRYSRRRNRARRSTPASSARGRQHSSESLERCRNHLFGADGKQTGIALSVRTRRVERVEVAERHKIGIGRRPHGGRCRPVKHDSRSGVCESEMRCTGVDRDHQSAPADGRLPHMQGPGNRINTGSFSN